MATGSLPKRALAIALVAFLTVAAPVSFASVALPDIDPVAGDDPAHDEKNTDEPKKGGWRLADSKSDYLREHASNPVEWHIWGKEAFDKAKKLDRMIFLSIGYSSCHWCHVMRRESFSSEKIAAYMNENFINIKIDREELPHVDDVYMDAVRNLSRGRGGWPLSVWLTPELVPVMGGTYFPPETRFGRLGFLEVLERIQDLWKNRRVDFENQGKELIRLMADANARRGAGVATGEFVSRGINAKVATFDEQWGGFGEKPKFPSPRVITSFAARAVLEDLSDLQEKAVHTLRQWAAGGIHDQVGGGFHRYSVDEKWAVPHFEKMLYNQGLNAEAYLDVHRMTGAADLKEIARGTLDAMLRDFGLDHGGFASSWDADSEDEEGTFYVWTPAQVKEIVGADKADLLCDCLGITAQGNFEGGRSVASRRKSVEELARNGSFPIDFARRSIDEGIAKLFEARAKRIPPHKDEKVILGWNSLAISALAKGSIILGDNKYLTAATRAHAFVRKNLVTDAAFLRRYSRGESDYPATLRDVAYHLKACVDLYEASLDHEHIRVALETAGRIIADYGPGADGGGFYETRPGMESLLPRHKRFHDGALPSGNGTLARTFLRLHALTGEAKYREHAENIVREGSQVLSRPEYSPEMMLAALALISPRPEVAVVGDIRHPGVRAFLDPARRGPAPFVTVAHRPLGPMGEQAARVIPLLRDRTAQNGRPTAYLCIDFVCQAPETDPARFAKALAAAWKPVNDADRPLEKPKSKETDSDG